MAPDQLMIVTIADRKALKVRWLVAQSERAVEDLRAFARLHGGRFIVFGSTASGTQRHDSDFDLMVDFAPPADREAYFFAEATCLDHGLRPDIHYFSEAPDALLRRIGTDARVLV